MVIKQSNFAGSRVRVAGGVFDGREAVDKLSLEIFRENIEICQNISYFRKALVQNTRSVVLFVHSFRVIRNFRQAMTSRIKKNRQDFIENRRFHSVHRDDGTTVQYLHTLPSPCFGHCFRLRSSSLSSEPSSDPSVTRCGYRRR